MLKCTKMYQFENKISSYNIVVTAWLCGRWRIRTADPLLVRQMLWTSWAKRPKCVSFEKRCKDTANFYICKLFDDFFEKIFVLRVRDFFCSRFALIFSVLRTSQSNLALIRLALIFSALWASQIRLHLGKTKSTTCFSFSIFSLQ